MKTHCSQKTFPFQTKNSRDVVAHFNGGNISSDGGSLLLQQTDQITGIIRHFAGGNLGTPYSFAWLKTSTHRRFRRFEQNRR